MAAMAAAAEWSGVKAMAGGKRPIVGWSLRPCVERTLPQLCFYIPQGVRYISAVAASAATAAAVAAAATAAADAAAAAIDVRTSLMCSLVRVVYCHAAFARRTLCGPSYVYLTSRTVPVPRVPSQRAAASRTAPPPTGRLADDDRANTPVPSAWRRRRRRR